MTATTGTCSEIGDAPGTGRNAEEQELMERMTAPIGLCPVLDAAPKPNFVVILADDADESKCELMCRAWSWPGTTREIPIRRPEHVLGFGWGCEELTPFSDIPGAGHPDTKSR